MDIIKISNQEVIKCPHCNGTGMCEKSVLESVLEYTGVGQKFHRICSTCGTGIAVYGQGASPPVCRICGGKGFHRV